MKNNTTTRNLTAIVAVLMAATLVGTFATVAAVTQPAFAAAPQKKPPGHDDKKDKARDGSGNDNDNTVTIEECKNRGSASGFDTALDQECENLICTHPGENVTCTEEGVSSVATPTRTIQVSGQGEGENFCPNAEASLPASITFSVQQSGNAAAQGQFEITAQDILGTLPKTGTLDSVQITGNSFTITGTELSQPGPIMCGDIQLPSSATINGQCGTGVTIQFATADGEHATFTNANVQCTTT
jgi:hypothetical protein